MKHLHRILIVLSLLLLIVPLSVTLALVSHLQASAAGEGAQVSATEQNPSLADLRQLLALQQWRAQSVPGSVSAITLSHMYEDMVQRMLINEEVEALRKALE